MPHTSDAQALLGWYRRKARKLPWRDAPTPYHVLLSEFMLQQTRVETVLPYYEDFLRRWPTMESLASAPESAVLQAWSGLGYYRRARMLCRAARAAVDMGGLPSTPDALQRLPGIGPYTAGAIASIAFDRPAPAIDGNVERVLARRLGMEDSPRSQVGRSRTATAVQALLAAGPASAINQGLMELGATVCTPRNPKCEACPWEGTCQARRTGRVAELPRRPPRKRPVPIQGVAGLLRRDQKVLMGLRPRRGLLGGLWEPIGAELPARANAKEALCRAFHERAGLEVTEAWFRGQVVHVFTHRRLTLTVFGVRAERAPVKGAFYDALDWVDPEEPGVALSSLAKRTLAIGSS